ncbi:restriction endonuclease [Paenibacillus wulumuqiensis]|uniref:restriction endonuclease n=1 Tax=Paenibacillus wulumuqiensis TaxID=1567107 RepID=UPI0006960BBB|nr:restriction endonuclease [Paenibacillus wulumuqiensis]
MNNDFFIAQPMWMYGLTAVIVILLLVLIIRGLRRRSARIRREQLDPRRITIGDIDQMEGAEFERYLYRLFHELGYVDTFKTKDSSDFGADLVFTDRHGVRNVLQAKRYQENNAISLDAVQEVYGSMRYYQAGRSIVLTSARRFTAACETLAGVNGVKLLNREDLIQLMDDFKSGHYEDAMDCIEAEAYTVLSPWAEYLDKPMRSIGKDRKAEKWLRNR